MPLTPEQEQELAELEELEQLEKELGQPNSPAAPVNWESSVQKQLQDPTLQSMATGMFGMGGVANSASAVPKTIAQYIGKTPVVGRHVQSALQKPGDVGDWLMQKAAGMRKYIPGVGRTMSAEGVKGTRSGMANRLEAALDRTGQKISTLASGLDDIPTVTPAAKIADRAQKLIQPDGHLHKYDTEEFKALNELADDVMSRGPSVSGSTAAAARTTSGRLARNAGGYRDNPAESIKAHGTTAEQAGWSEALKTGYAKTNPGARNQLAEADEIFSKLSQAKRPLLAPQTIPQTPLSIKASNIPGVPFTEQFIGNKLLGLERFLGGPKSGYVGNQLGIKVDRRKGQK